MKNFQYQNNIRTSKNNIDVSVSIISFIDDNTHIIFCPALDLSGYGMDETEAKASFDLVLNEYLDYTFNKGTIWDDLKGLGWEIKKTKKASAIPPAMKDLLNNNEEFSRIFNNYPFKKFNTSVAIPAA